MQMWTVKLTVLPGGLVQVAASDGIPPGEIEIRGGDDGTRIILEARQRDRDGRFVISAHHRRDRAEEALAGAEADVRAAELAGDAAGLDVEGSVAVGESITVTRE